MISLHYLHVGFPLCFHRWFYVLSQVLVGRHHGFLISSIGKGHSASSTVEGLLVWDLLSHIVLGLDHLRLLFGLWLVLLSSSGSDSSCDLRLQVVRIGFKSFISKIGSIGSFIYKFRLQSLSGNHLGCSSLDLPSILSVVVEIFFLHRARTISTEVGSLVGNHLFSCSQLRLFLLFELVNFPFLFAL
jgi:hypothetical protein